MKRHMLAMLFVVFGVGHVGLQAAGDLLPALPSLPSLPSLPNLPSLPSLGGMPDLSKSLLPLQSTGPSTSVGVGSLASSNALDTGSSGVDAQDAKGSWWKKRHFLLKAREQQEKINSLIASIQDAGGPLYDVKRAGFNQDVTAFYEKNAVGRGQIDQLLEQLSPYFNQPANSDEAKVVDKDMARLASSKKFQDYFDNTVLFAQLKADLQAIVDIDSGVADRVAQFEKCSQQALQKGAEAQSIVNEIFPMVNHEKARESYYKLEGIAAYLGAILKFVKTDLAADLDKLIGLGRSRMDDVSKVIVNVRSACDALKKSEVVLGDDAATTDAGSKISTSDFDEHGGVKDDSVSKPSLHKASDAEQSDVSVASEILMSVIRFFSQIFYVIVDLFKMLIGK